MFPLQEFARSMQRLEDAERVQEDGGDLDSAAHSPARGRRD